ncbi:hypothetical protein E9K33_03800 [Escherichia coli]|nr:hypothetical protein E9K33_03800 [Escherichia coli]
MLIVARAAKQQIKSAERIKEGFNNTIALRKSFLNIQLMRKESRSSKQKRVLPIVSLY